MSSIGGGKRSFEDEFRPVKRVLLDSTMDAVAPPTPPTLVVDSLSEDMAWTATAGGAAAAAAVMPLGKAFVDEGPRYNNALWQRDEHAYAPVHRFITSMGHYF